MKRPISTALALLISAVLVLFGIFYGAFRGWQGEYKQVQSLFGMEDGMNRQLNYRAYDALNLEKVALRHLGKTDADVAAMAEAANALMNEKSSLHERFLANQSLSTHVDKVHVKLSAALNAQSLSTADMRDKSYLDQITQSIAQANDSIEKSEYNQRAQEYNSRIRRAPSGVLARLMFVKLCDEFK